MLCADIIKIYPYNSVLEHTEVDDMIGNWWWWWLHQKVIRHVCLNHNTKKVTVACKSGLLLPVTTSVIF